MAQHGRTGAVHGPGPLPDAAAPDKLTPCDGPPGSEPDRRPGSKATRRKKCINVFTFLHYTFNM